MWCGAGQLGHGGVVGFDVFVASGSGDAGDVVGSGEDDQNFGMEIDYILLKADEHLRSSLSVDTAVDVGLAGKIVWKLPVVGDGVAEKHDAIFFWSGQCECGIGLAVAFQFSEVVGVDGDAGGAVLIEIGVAGGGDRLLGEL